MAWLFRSRRTAGWPLRIRTRPDVWRIRCIWKDMPKRKGYTCLSESRRTRCRALPL